MEMHQGSSSAGSSKVEVKDAEMAESSNSRSIPMMVSIMAPSTSTRAEQRVPVDLVLLLHAHVRYKAPDKWQDLLMEAVRVVMDKLDDKDRLAVVPGGGGSSISKESLKYTETLLPMSSDNKASCSDAVRTAIQKCDNSLVRALESANSILHGQGGYSSNEKERRAGYIIVISNSQEDMASLVTWRFRSVLAFGFRDARNARTMDAITRSRDCTYAILDDDRGRVTEAFAGTVDRIISGDANMAVEVELQYVGHQEVVRTKVVAPHVSYFVSYDKRKIWASAHLPGSGAATSFIVDLSLTPVPPAEVDLSGLVTVRAKYGHAPDDTLERQQALTVNLKGGCGSKEVAAEMIRIKAIEMVDEITKDDETDPEKLHALADKLSERWTDLSRSLGDIMSMLDAEMREMEIRLYNNYLWLEYMLSWRSHQWWQLPLPRMFMEDPFVRLTVVSAKVDDASTCTTHRRPVLLRIVAPEAGLAKAKRHPVHLVAVLDVRDEAGDGTNDKAKERRMEQLTEAMMLVMDKLSHKDRLAIIPVQSHSSPHPHAHVSGFLEMSEEGRSETSAKLQCLVDQVLHHTASANNKAPEQQTSHYRHQFKKSMEHVRRWLYIPSVSESILTLPSAGTQCRAFTGGSTGVWKALVDAVKILDDREETEKDHPGFIMVISNSGDESIPRWQESLKPKYITHAFSCHNSDARTTRDMHYLASSSRGIYASLHDHRNQLTEAFTACIKRITSTIGVQTTIEIKCTHPSVSLCTTESGELGPRIGEDGRSVSIKVDNLYAGTAKNFMFNMENACDNLSDLLDVKFTWGGKVDDQVVIVNNGSDGSAEVMEDIARAETGKIICEITDPNYDMAADKLHKCLKQASMKAQASGDAPLAGEMEKMAAILHRKMRSQYPDAVDPSYVKKLLEDRLSNMLSWLSFQALSEQPPRIPWRSSFQPELLQNYPHKKQE
ncbi:uncharacterized protein [Triticum aestivum]|uniref:uncharacterized protein isoform X1 n=1 Tax=Triticum aestivum TaxID=4565 RepID=UPI001D01FC0B|nr:uncharacterized protein LOC123135345 isoform X1 [Triticum aestivum]